MTSFTPAHRLLLTGLLVLIIGSPALYTETRQDNNGEDSLGDVTISNVSLSDFDADGVEMEVEIQATANATTTLRSLTLERVTLNGLRVTVPPLRGEFRLRAGQPIAGMPPLHTRIPFRELESLEPLRQIVRDGSVRVQGVLRGQIQLNLFQTLALRGGGAWIVKRIDHNVPVEIPGGEIGRLAALTTLTAAEPMWIASDTLRRAWQSAQERVLRAADLPEIARSIVALETRFDLKARTGDTVSLRHLSSGFSMGGGRILAPAESIEPWMFDPEIAEAIATRDVSPVDSSVEIVATTASADAPPAIFSSLQGGLSVGRKLSSTSTLISTTTRRRIRVRLRADDANAARLEVRGWNQSALPEADRREEWQPAAILIPRRQGNRVAPELLHTAIRFNDGRYQIRDAVDAAAFGSPVWTERGVAALLQDESSAAELKTVMKRLK